MNFLSLYRPIVETTGGCLNVKKSGKLKKNENRNARISLLMHYCNVGFLSLCGRSAVVSQLNFPSLSRRGQRWP